MECSSLLCKGIFKFIESNNVCASDDKIKDCKTALHSSCIHNHVEIAEYICENLKLTRKNVNDLNEFIMDGSSLRGYWNLTRCHGKKLIKILVKAGIHLRAKTCR